MVMTDDQPVADGKDPSKRWRRVLLLSLCAVVLAPLGLVLAGQGASNWCTGEGFRRSSGFAQELTISAWPPGVKCTLEFDSDKTDIYWPIDW